MENDVVAYVIEKEWDPVNVTLVLDIGGAQYKKLKKVMDEEGIKIKALGGPIITEKILDLFDKTIKEEKTKEEKTKEEKTKEEKTKEEND